MKKPETKICPIMSAHRNIDCVQGECEFWVERYMVEKRDIEGRCSIPLIAMSTVNIQAIQ